MLQQLHYTIHNSLTNRRILHYGLVLLVLLDIQQFEHYHLICNSQYNYTFKGNHPK